MPPTNSTPLTANALAHPLGLAVGLASVGGLSEVIESGVGVVNSQSVGGN